MFIPRRQIAEFWELVLSRYPRNTFPRMFIVHLSFKGLFLITFAVNTRSKMYISSFFVPKYNTFRYIGDLNTRLVWYSNGQNQYNNQMVCCSNGDLNTGLFLSVIQMVNNCQLFSCPGSNRYRHLNNG